MKDKDTYLLESAYSLINNKKLLNEAQLFKFDYYKPQIFDMIKKIRGGASLSSFEQTTPDGGKSNIFYSIIVNDDDIRTGAFKKIGMRDDTPKQWKAYFQNSNVFNPNGLPIWSQRDFNSKLKNKQDGKTYNYYITIDRSDKQNVARFANNVMKLDEMLRQYAEKTNTAISWKTHGILDAFLGHNDSLKIYYYNPSQRDEIESIVKKWVTDNNINIADRTHVHGVDIKGQGSYGQILSKYILEKFYETVKKYPTATEEQLFQAIKSQFGDVIKRMKV